FLPDKSLGKIDIHMVLFTGNGVLQSIAVAFANPLGSENALRPFSLNRDFRSHQPGDRIGRSQKFPGHAAQLSREDLAERFNLLIRRGRLHDENTSAVAIMNGFMAVED